MKTNVDIDDRLIFGPIETVKKFDTVNRKVETVAVIWWCNSWFSKQRTNNNLNTNWVSIKRDDSKFSITKRNSSGTVTRVTISAWSSVCLYSA